MKKIIIHFIKYPVAVSVFVTAFVLLGVMGATSLKSSFFPLSESRNITIQITYPGASPAEMEEGIVLKIEDNLQGLVGVDRFTSTSSENSASVKVEVLKGYDVSVVLDDIKNAVDKVPSFPSGMEPPVISKEVFRTEAVSFVLSGESVSLRTLKEMGRDVESDIREIEGISQIEMSGFPNEEIEIALNEDKLRAFNLTFQEVSRAVSAHNILSSGGSIKTPNEEFLIRVKNRSYFGTDLDYVVVKAMLNGDKVYLKDVADVQDKWSESPNRSYYNGQPSINFNVNTTNSEDLISVAALTVDYIEKFNESHNNVQLNVTKDASQTIIERTELLTKNALQGMALVLFFLALFLKPRLAFWVAFGLPISFLGMFMFAGYFGVTINVLSLFGMIIVIGILVDDGIVIAENIYHHYELGKNSVQAAIDGTLEVLPAIVSAIATTLVAFSTFFFLDGKIGEFFGEVAVIVILTLLVSLIEALIILPSHMAHSKALTKEQKTYSFNRWADNLMNFMRDKLYGPYLVFFIKNKALGMAIPIALLLLTLGSIGGGIIKFTFFPQIASDRVVVTLKMPQGTNETITDSIITSIEQKAWGLTDSLEQTYGLENPIENIIKKVGPGTSTASLNINLLPGEKRNFPSYIVSTSLSERVGNIGSAEAIEYGSGSNFGGKPVSLSIMGRNTIELKAAKDFIKGELRKNTLLKDLTDNDPEGIKEIKITLKENAYALGFTLNDVISQVRSGFFGSEVQRFQRGQDEVKVWVRYELAERTSLQQLDDMRLVNVKGNRVPLREVANYEIDRGEISINHLNGKREIRIDADLKNPSTSATDMMAEIKSDLIPVMKERFPGVDAIFEGQNRQAEQTGSSAAAVLPIIVFLIFLIIAFTFRSFDQPIVLLIMIPFSLIGVAWGHWIHGYAINVLSFLGIIALIGIIVNDGLVLISKFNIYLKRGMKYDEALIAAGKSRFRAIFLTTITTIAGLSPLIFETSRQAQFLIPMAIAIAYGIALATVLTLIMLPLMLKLSNEIKVLWKWYTTGIKPTPEEVEGAVIELKSEQDEF
ncbi:MAG: multidrug efflux pump subunit AcrB [Salibacteraceae bacterium]|jgi:multidrug efflux pump subunit AcrB